MHTWGALHSDAKQDAGSLHSAYLLGVLVCCLGSRKAGGHLAIFNPSPPSATRPSSPTQLSLRHMNWLRMTTQLADHERGHIENFYRVPASAGVEPFSAQNRCAPGRCWAARIGTANACGCCQACWPVSVWW